MKKKKKPQIAGRCVFCNGFGLTKEHIWSDWLSKRGALAPRASHLQTGTDTKYSKPLNSVIVKPILKRKNGGMVSRQIRNVCKICNNGWMKTIVDESVEIAEPLVRGNNINLSVEDQVILSKWIFLSTVMAEFTDPRTLVIPKDDRDSMFSGQKIPREWTIFIGKYSGREWYPARYRHHGLKFIRPQSAIPFLSVIRSEFKNYQVSTYTLGSLLVHVMSSTDPTLVGAFRNNFAPNSLAQIWPARSDVAFASLPTVEDDAMMLLADQFHDDFMSQSVFRPELVPD